MKRYLLLAAFSFLLYSPALFNGFLSDDFALLQDRALTPPSAGELFSPAYWKGVPEERRGRFRPLRTLSLLADRAVYGERPAGYHLTNALLNTAAVLAAAGLGEALFGPWTGLAGAAVFAAYPVHVESVAWVKNRSDLLCALFSFLSLWAGLLFMRRGRARAAAAAAGFCLLGLLSKETAAAVPLAGLAMSRLFAEGAERRRGYLLWLGLLAAAAAWFVSKEFWWRPELAAAPPGDAHSQLAAVLYTLGSYLALLAFPFRLAAERAFEPAGGWPPGVKLALAALPALAAWLWYRRDREALFALGWTLLLLLPVLNFVPLESRPLAEQRLYLPSLGVAWLAALAAWRLRGWRPARPLLGALLLVLSAASLGRTFVWRDDLSFWRDAVAKNPSNYRANYNLAAEYQRRGSFGEAVKYYEAAARDADLPEIYYSLAFCYDKVGEYPRSLEAYRMVERLAQRPSPDLYNNMAIVYEKTGDCKRAGELYRRALAVDPAYAPARKNLEDLCAKK